MKNILVVLFTLLAFNLFSQTRKELVNLRKKHSEDLYSKRKELSYEERISLYKKYKDEETLLKKRLQEHQKKELLNSPRNTALFSPLNPIFYTTEYSYGDVFQNVAYEYLI